LKLSGKTDDLDVRRSGAHLNIVIILFFQFVDVLLDHRHKRMLLHLALTFVGSLFAGYGHMRGFRCN